MHKHACGEEERRRKEEEGVMAGRKERLSKWVRGRVILIRKRKEREGRKGRKEGKAENEEKINERNVWSLLEGGEEESLSSPHNNGMHMPCLAWHGGKWKEGRKNGECPCL